MSTILDLSAIAANIGQPITIWRDQLLPAMFRGQQFHMESIGRESGTHVVTHQFPKRDIPYSEPMGRRAFEFTIKAYCIAYPFDSNQPLYQRDYRTPRNNLINVLDAGLPGILQLPTLPPLTVLCTRYRISEEEKLGGYCTFDITFVEYGVKPTMSAQDTFAQAIATSESLKTRVQNVLSQNPALPNASKSPPSVLPSPSPLRQLAPTTPQRRITWQSRPFGDKKSAGKTQSIGQMQVITPNPPYTPRISTS